MRLLCPSCGAEYEVDDSVIPDAGRDVQCSNCGNAWFQASAAQLLAEGAEPPAPETSRPWTGDDTASGDASAAEPYAADAPEPAAGPAETAPAAAETATPDATKTDADAAPMFRRRTLDDAVLNVLREEAAREARVRNVQGATLETQPDLGLPSAAVAALATAETPKDRVANTRGNATDMEDEDALVSRGSRRELLPDIEEINSTLRATSERGGEAASLDAPETLRRRRSGFRLGFSVALISASILLATYLLAPTIAAKVPALQPVMVRYVKGIERSRNWIDQKLQSSTEAMRGTGSK